jgi:hypothetical protein
MKTSTERSREWRQKNPTSGESRESSRRYREKKKSDELYKIKNKLRQKKNYDERKKLKNAEEKQTDEIGYNSRNTLLTKVRVIKQQLPTNQVKRKEVLRELCKNIPAAPKETQQKNQSEAKKLAIDFVNKDSVSTQLPGKKDEIKVVSETGETVFMRKRVLKDSTQLVFNEFKNENPGVKLGLTSFRGIIPKNVLPFSKMPIFSCLCKYHENFRLIFEGVKEFLIDRENITSYKDLLSKLTCTTDNFECMNGMCVNCESVDDVIKKQLFKFERNQKIRFVQWVSDDRHHTEEMSLSIKDFYTHFIDQSVEFKQHAFTASAQSSHFDEDMKNLQNDTALMVQDFSENFSCIPQNEIQQAFYTRASFTLFTVCVYVCQGEEKTPKSYGIISDSKHHDKVAVNGFMNEIFKEIQEQHPHIKNVIIWSDGAPSHFKNAFSLTNLSRLQQMFGFEKLSWNFHASSHGKSQVDGIGGSIKAMVDRRVKSHKLTIKTAFQFFEHAQKICTAFNIRYVSEATINSHCANLDLFWKTTRKIPNIRKLHRFDTSEDKKYLDCFLISAKIGEKRVKIIK